MNLTPFLLDITTNRRAEPPKKIPPNVHDAEDDRNSQTCGGIRYAGSTLRLSTRLTRIQLILLIP